jgi:phosphoribosylformylglycinamidine synthase
VVCAGGKPLAITNCLNYGNPYKPEVFWVFKESVGGMGDACRALGTPVTGGNVSFYNENPDGAVFPTPTIGMLGLVDNVEEHTTTAAFKEVGDDILLLSPGDWTHRDDIGGSEYLAWIHGKTAGDAPHMELDEEKAIQDACLAMIRAGHVQSAHDVSDGGLVTCLAESILFSDELGADVHLDLPAGCRWDSLLFGEAQSRIVLSARSEQREAVEALARRHGIRVTRIGSVTGGGLSLNIDGRSVMNLTTEVMAKPYHDTIPALMG